MPTPAKDASIADLITRLQQLRTPQP